MSNERLGMFEELAKAKGQLEGALVLELIDWIRKLKKENEQLRTALRGVNA